MLWKGILIFMILGLASCFKKENYASTPAIEFVSFVKTQDSAKVTIKFRDGEGDIGLNDDQTSTPFNIESKYHYNLYLVYYEKKDGVWAPGLDLNGDSIVFKNRLRPIYSGKPKSISGEIVYTIEPFYFNIGSPNNDTIQYKIQLIDRALNESLWLNTPEIYP
jgi:hypothetical protein